jgi:hypothetical protein
MDKPNMNRLEFNLIDGQVPVTDRKPSVNDQQVTLSVAPSAACGVRLAR